MKKKIVHKFVFAIIWLGLVVSSFIIFDQIGGRGYTILIVAPKNGHVQTQEATQYQTDIRITYATSQNVVVTALAHEHHITMIGTNHYLARVMNYLWVAGNFFDQDAVRYAHPVAVLNINAAMDIFGERRAVGHSFYFESEPFQVIGVIDDRDARGANLYVPITSMADSGGADAWVFDAGILYFYDQPEILDLLQAFGVTEASYHIINLFAAHKLTEHYHILTVALFILVIFEAITSHAGKIALRNWRKITRQTEEETNLRKIIFSKSCLMLLAAVVVIVLVFTIIGLESTGVFLRIAEIIRTPNPFAGIPETAFLRHIAELARWYFWIIAVFWTALATFVLYFVVNIWRSFSVTQVNMNEEEHRE